MTAQQDISLDALLQQYAEVPGVPLAVVRRLSRGKLVVDPEAVQRAVDQLAVRVAVELWESNPIFLTELSGGNFLCGLLLPKLGFPLQDGGCILFEESSVNPAVTRNVVLHPLNTGAVTPLQDRTVVIMLANNDPSTLSELSTWAESEQIRRLYCCGMYRSSLVDGLEGMEANVPVAEEFGSRDNTVGGKIVEQFCALELPEGEFVGCGLNYLGYGANLPGIYLLPS